MRDLSSVAKQLRVVRNARRRFLELWKVEKELINPALDRMADELRKTAATPARPAGENRTADD
jgi:hypothetical protein